MSNYNLFNTNCKKFVENPKYDDKAFCMKSEILQDVINPNHCIACLKKQLFLIQSTKKIIKEENYEYQ